MGLSDLVQDDKATGKLARPDSSRRTWRLCEKKATRLLGCPHCCSEDRGSWEDFRGVIASFIVLSIAGGKCPNRL